MGVEQRQFDSVAAFDAALKAAGDKTVFVEFTVPPDSLNKVEPWLAELNGPGGDWSPRCVTHAFPQLAPRCAVPIDRCMKATTRADSNPQV